MKSRYKCESKEFPGFPTHLRELNPHARKVYRKDTCELPTRLTYVANFVITNIFEFFSLKIEKVKKT